MASLQAPFRIEIRQNQKTLAFGPRMFGQAGKDIIAVKLALSVIQDIEGLEASRPEGEAPPPQVNPNPEIPLDQQRWFDCITGKSVTLTEAATFDESLRSAIINYQIKNQFLITCYLFHKYGILDILDNSRQTVSEYEEGLEQRYFFTEDQESGPLLLDSDPDSIDIGSGGLNNNRWSPNTSAYIGADSIMMVDEHGNPIEQEYSRVAMRILTSMINLFESELGMLSEATLALLHGWTPQSTIEATGYQHDQNIYSTGEGAGPVVDIVPEVLAAEAQGTYVGGAERFGQSIDDLSEQGFLYSEIGESFGYMRQAKLQRFADTAPDSYKKFLDKESPAKSPWRYAHVDYKPNYVNQSVLYAATVKVLKNDELNTADLPTADQREEMLRRMFYPDPFSTDEPFYIDRQHIGFYMDTDYVLAACGPLPENSEDVIRDLEDRALKKVLKFYEKPEIWILPENLNLMEPVYFGNQDQPGRSERGDRSNPSAGIYPTNTSNILKTFIPDFEYYRSRIIALRAELEEMLRADEEPSYPGDNLFNDYRMNWDENDCNISELLRIIESYPGAEEDPEDHLARVFVGRDSLNARQKACLRKYTRKLEELVEFERLFNKEPSQSQKNRAFYSLTTDDVLDKLEQNFGPDQAAARSWRLIEGFGRREPLIEFQEYRTPTLRDGQNYRAFFVLNTEKLNLIVDGEQFEEAEEEETTFADNSIDIGSCANLDDAESLRIFQEFKAHAKKNKHLMKRKFLERLQENDSYYGPGEVDMGRLGVTNTGEATSDLFRGLTGVNSLGNNSYEYTKNMMSLIGAPIDRYVLGQLSDLEDLTQGTSKEIQTRASENQTKKVHYSLSDLKERISILKKDLLQAARTMENESISLDPISEFDPQKEISILEKLANQLEVLAPALAWGNSKKAKENAHKIGVEFHLKYISTANGAGPKNGMQATKINFLAAWGKSDPEIQQIYPKMNWPPDSPLLRPRTLHYILNLNKMTSRSSGARYAGFGPWDWGAGNSTKDVLASFLDDSRGSCKDLGINAEKHIAVQYLSKYTSGLKALKDEKSDEKSFMSTWADKHFGEPWSKWWKSSKNGWNKTFNSEGQFANSKEDAMRLLGDVKDWNDIYRQFFDKLDLASIFCDYLKCIKLPGFDLKLPSFYLPPFPEVPAIGYFQSSWENMFSEQMGQLLMQALKVLVSTIIDKIAFPFCEDQLKEFIAAGSTLGGALANQALAEAFTDLGVDVAQKEKAKETFGDVANIVTGQELCHLLKGKPLDSAAMNMIERVVKASDIGSSLSTQDDITNFFGTIGLYVPDSICEQLVKMDDLPAPASCSDTAETLAAIRNKLQSGDGCLSDEEISEALQKAEEDLKNQEASLREFSGMEVGELMPPGYGIGNPNAVINTFPDFMNKGIQRTAESVFHPAKQAYLGTLSTYVPDMGSDGTVPNDARTQPGYEQEHYLSLEADATRLAMYSQALQQFNDAILVGAAYDETFDTYTGGSQFADIEDQEFIDYLQGRMSQSDFVASNFSEKESRLQEAAREGIAIISAYVHMILKPRRDLFKNIGLSRSRGDDKFTGVGSISYPDVTITTRGGLYSQPGRENTSIFSLRDAGCIDITDTDAENYPEELFSEITVDMIATDRQNMLGENANNEDLANRPDEIMLAWKFEYIWSGKYAKHLHQGDDPNATNQHSDAAHVEHTRKLSDWLISAYFDNEIKILELWAGREQDPFEGSQYPRAGNRRNIGLYRNPITWTPNDGQNDTFEPTFSTDHGPFRDTSPTIDRLNKAYGAQEEQVFSLTQRLNLVIQESERRQAKFESWTPKTHPGIAKFLFAMFETEEVEYRDPVTGETETRLVHKKYAVKPKIDPDTGEKYVPFVTAQQFPRTSNDTQYEGARSLNEYLSLSTTSALRDLVSGDVEPISVLSRELADSPHRPRPLTYEEYIQKLRDPNNEDMFVLGMISLEDIRYIAIGGDRDGRPVVYTRNVEEVGDEVRISEQELPNWPYEAHAYSLRGTTLARPAREHNQASRLSVEFSSTEEVVRTLLYKSSMIKETNYKNLDDRYDINYFHADGGDAIKKQLRWRFWLINLYEEDYNDPGLLEFISDRIQVLSKSVETRLQYSPPLIARLHLYRLKAFFNSNRPMSLGLQLNDANIWRPTMLDNEDMGNKGWHDRSLIFQPNAIYRPDINYRTFEGGRNQDAYEFVIQSDFHILQTMRNPNNPNNLKKFSYCESIPDRLTQHNSNFNRAYYSKKEVLAQKVVKNMLADGFSFNGPEEQDNLRYLIYWSHGHNRSPYAFCQGMHKELVDTCIYDKLLKSLKQSIMFEDDYAQEMHARLAGEARIDDNNCITNRYGLVSDTVLDFNKVILGDALKEYMREAAKPENSAFNAEFDKPDATEKSLQNLALRAFIKVCMIDTLLKGALAYAEWDIEPVVTTPVFKDYLSHHVLLELNRNSKVRKIWKEIITRTTNITNSQDALKSIIEEEIVKLPDFSKQVYSPNRPDLDFQEWFFENHVPVMDVPHVMGPFGEARTNQIYYMIEEEFNPGGKDSGAQTHLYIEEYIKLEGRIISKELRLLLSAEDSEFGLGIFEADPPFVYTSVRAFNQYLAKVVNTNSLTQEEKKDIIQNSKISHGARLNYLKQQQLPYRSNQHRNYNQPIDGKWPLFDTFGWPAIDDEEGRLYWADAVFNTDNYTMTSRRTRQYRIWTNWQGNNHLAISLPILKKERLLDYESCPAAFNPENPGLDLETSKDFIVSQLKETQEFKDYFQYIFPMKRYAAHVSLLSTSILGGYGTLPTKFEGAKTALAFIMEVCGVPASSMFDMIPISPEQFKKSITDQFPADPAKANCLDFPGGDFLKQFWEELLKLLIQLPSIIFRGIANQIDPAYKEMRAHYLNCDLRRMPGTSKENPYGDFGLASLTLGTVDDTTINGLLLKSGRRGSERGAYAPIIPTGIIDIAQAFLSPWPMMPARLTKTLLKTVAYIYSGQLPFVDIGMSFSMPCISDEPWKPWEKDGKYDAGHYGRYGHPLTPITILALGTPALKSDMTLKNAACRQAEGIPPPEECSEYEDP